MNYTAGEISTITGAKIIGNENVIIKNIAYDSRIIYSPEDTAFIAINSSKNSGERFIQNAIDQGIRVIIAEKNSADNPEITWMIVDDSLKFLQNLARFHGKQFPHLKTIGITGSNGKTIVKEWLSQSLSNEFKTVKSPKSFNSQLGLPLSVLQISKGDEIGIFEIGISKPGEMLKLEQILSPQIGVLTHIGTAHSANFSDESSLIDEKLQLFKNSETIIYNGDNTALRDKILSIYKDKNLISFGLKNNSDICISDNSQDKTIPVKIKIFDKELEIPISHRHDATLSNALCIIAILHYLGFSQEKITEKINQLRAVEMRLESVEGNSNNLIINDSYNLDLDSLKIAFQFLKEYNRPKKVLVLTDFVETKFNPELYNEIAKSVNKQNFDEIYLIGQEIIKYKNLIKSNTYIFNSIEELIVNPNFNQIHDALILLKGARKFELDKVKSHLELQKHDTVLQVNLNAILHNINVHKEHLKPETKVMAMVKAFSYGLGGYEIAEFLQHHHIDYLGVAYADEGVELRKRGITVPIMVMNPEQHSYDTIIDHALEPEIYSFRVLQRFCEQLDKKGFQGKYPIHIKLETGMHRLGFKTEELEDLAEKLQSANVVVKSVFSHLSSADDPSEEEYTKMQIRTFEENSNTLIRAINYKPIRHILNSAGIINYTDSQFDMVRIGIGMIGISPNMSIKKQLLDVVKFKTVISQISTLKSGETVSYNRRYKADQNVQIATIPVGYADGIPRLIGNGKGKVAVNGHLVPIVGSVCMDMMMLDVSNVNAKEGNEVTIFNGSPSLEQYADYCQTIPYEALTSISRRVKRIYIKN